METFLKRFITRNRDSKDRSRQPIPAELLLDFRGVISPIGRYDPINGLAEDAHVRQLRGETSTDEFYYDRSGDNASYWSSELAGYLSQYVSAGRIRLTWLTSDWPRIPDIDTSLGLNRRQTHCKIVDNNQDKLAIVRQMIRHCGSQKPTRRLIWVDDDLGSDYRDEWCLLQDKVAKHKVAMLKVTPDCSSGISRSQWRTISQFISGQGAKRGKVQFCENIPANQLFS